MPTMPPTLLQTPCGRALAALVVCGAPAIGCHHLPGNSKAVKYQTVPASNRHDVRTARAKHGEALAYLDDPRFPKLIAKAETLLNEALVADVTYGPAHNSLGMVYYLQGKLYLAAWEYEYAAKLMPETSEPYNNLGLVYERVGKYEDAVSYYSMAMSHDQNSPEVIANLVRARMIMGERTADIRDMISDLALSHPDPDWQNWARDQVELTNFDDAAPKLNEAFLSPENEPEALPIPIGDPAGEAIPEADLHFPQSVQGTSTT